MPSTVIDFTSNTYSFKSATAVIDGHIVKLGLKSIAISDSLETKAVTDGQSRLPVGVVVGNYVAKSSLEWLTLESYNEIVEALGQYWLEKTFPISVSFAEKGKKTYTIKLPQVRMLGADMSASGSDAISVKTELLPLDMIDWGGFKPMS